MPKMPVLFVGHGSPMNAIEDNQFTRGWKEIAALLPRPKAILCVSAHWYTSGLRVMTNNKPRMIYDMYGFPRQLYEVVYAAPGSPEIAAHTLELLGGNAIAEGSWGFDHGTWSVLRVMVPQADIPVFQLSVDGSAGAQAQLETGKKIAALREEGVLILSSGNVVHNLGLVDMGKPDGYDWAYDFDEYVKKAILARKFEDAVDYRGAGGSARLAFPTPDHYYPLLTALGAAEGAKNVRVFNEACMAGSMSMTCYLME